MAVEAVSTVASNPIYTSVTFYLSIAAALISIATLTVGYTQMKIASAKVKLDLYNKRFNVYLSALDYYKAAWGEDDEDFKEKGLQFIRCYRESKFLFDEKDGVFNTLTSIKDCGGPIGAYRKAKAEDQKTGGSSASALHDRNDKAFDQLKNDLLVLETQMAKYIDFKVVDGWTFF
ncbi:hypothetical protein [Pseudomonas monteilii]|uniref:hypothetical protein n=1 Tax=Pseudomonas monteilii TaxID=76759 RepID=UPI0005AA94BD|nr:hypothetical protein [Pseudomonas monteilii]